MRKKLSGASGLTLVEMMAAVVILILLGLLLNTGLQMAVSTYRAIVAQSEVELLLSTAVDALADDLRYARNVEADGTYTSDSYGEGTTLGLDAEGQLVAQCGTGEKRVLSTGAYGLNRAYRMSAVAEDKEIVTWNDASGTFTIELRVETTDGKISAETPDNGVIIRCLNPRKNETGGET